MGSLKLFGSATTRSIIMLWIDVALKSGALAATVIATLRAGSRVSYLLEHDAIGIMEGPTIANSNESYPLFELSESFRHCVRLGIAPHLYEHVQSKLPVTTVVEPYPLSQRPYLPRRTIRQETTETDDTSTDESIPDESLVPEAVAQAEKEPSLWSLPYRSFKSAVSTVPSSISYTRKYLAITPQLASYWSSRLWNWRTETDEESDVEEDGKAISL